MNTTTETTLRVARVLLEEYNGKVLRAIRKFAAEATIEVACFTEGGKLIAAWIDVCPPRAGDIIRVDGVKYRVLRNEVSLCSRRNPKPGDDGWGVTHRRTIVEKV